MSWMLVLVTIQALGAAPRVDVYHNIHSQNDCTKLAQFLQTKMGRSETSFLCVPAVVVWRSHEQNR